MNLAAALKLQRLLDGLSPERRRGLADRLASLMPSYFPPKTATDAAQAVRELLQ